MKVPSLAFAIILMLHSSVTVAQQSSATGARSDEVWEVGPAQCQFITPVLDVLTQNVAPDELITVVARLGVGETRPNLNRRRLHNVRVYWTEYLTAFKRKPETIILAEGEKVEGDGRLEFYVGGKLTGILKVRSNGDLYVGTCYPPDDSYIREKVYGSYIRKKVYDHCWVKEDRNFYPCRDLRTTRKNRRRVRGSL